MGKAKKGKKGRDDFEDDEEIDMQIKNAEVEDEKPDKKKKKKKKDKELQKLDEESLSENDEAIPKAPAPSKSKKKKKGKSTYISDEDDDIIDVFAELNQNKSLDLDYDIPKKKKTGFAFLDVDDEVSNEEIVSDDEPKETEEKEAVPEVKESKAKKQKEKKKKKKQEEENLDELLQELALEYDGVKPSKATEKDSKKVTPNFEDSNTPQETPADSKEGDVETSKSKKKKKKDKVLDGNIEEKKPIVAVKSEVAKAQVPETSENLKDNFADADGEPEGKDEDDEEDDGQKKKKKKDKKKGKESKEEKDDKKKKGPGKKVLAAMQEQLKKIQEEEEKKRLEIEEKERLAELAEEMRLEKIRLEKERKEREKQKKKERIQKLKEEGKYLTAKQKMEKARAQAMLESLRAQGIALPLPGEKKARPMDRHRRKNDKRPIPMEVKSAEEIKISETASVEEVSDNKIEKPKEEEEIKESWDQDISDDIKESWDQDSSGEVDAEEKPVPPVIQKTVEITVKKEADESEEEDQETSEEEEGEEEEEESSDSESSSEDEKLSDAQVRKMKAAERIKKRKEENEAKRNPDILRAPVVCVLGHVDTGKTKILDKLRKTHVQDGEAGGITQQIGATNVPHEAIIEQCKMVKEFGEVKLNIPGMLIIDTPGHESFSNLRSRGSSLCDIAVLVVDIMHGLEPQTIESINLLKKGKTPFVVALNKIDRLYEWKSNRNKDVRDVINSQARNTQMEFEERLKSVVVQFAEQSLNARVFYDNPDPRKYISIIPTSAITGDGMGNLMALVSQFSQTMLSKRITYSEELQATVLEVKAIPGLGTTIDVILINGVLKEGQTVILAGTEGPIVTQIRSLLMPQPMKELRVKNAYREYKEIQAAQGVKVAAKELEKTIAGLQLLVALHPDEVEVCKAEVSHELRSALQGIRLQERGVYVQASTLGSLEALLEFLKTSSIPYSGIRIGPVVKKDVMRASIMLEHDHTFACILAFDVKIERDAQELADSLGVKIFQADIIYHLFDKFMAYRDDLKQKEREKHKHIAVFPCKLKILPQFIFNSRDPIVMGVNIENGVLREGTPICVPSKSFLDIGIVTTIESNHKSVDTARKGQEVCIKIEPIPGESPKMFGRHFEETDMLVSKISRESIDACKNYFRDDLSKAEWQLMVELKKMFQII